MKSTQKKNIKNHLVSVIMNCHNGEKYLQQSLNSLLIQSYNNWELIFYDNCSTDNSALILKRYRDKRIKYFKSNKKLNLGLARKKALEKARGKLITFLDTDDLWKKINFICKLRYLITTKLAFLSPTQPFLINQKVDISILLGSILKEGFL